MEVLPLPVKPCEHAVAEMCSLFISRVPAGFPSPADDYLEGTLDLNSYLIRHPAATFFVRVEGESMRDAGIYPGDLLIVDRALEPMDNCVIIAAVDGELTVKRLCRRRGRLYLMPENPDYEPLPVDEDTPFDVWGVVTSVIHAL